MKKVKVILDATLRGLMQNIGNKRYMKDIESIFSKLEECDLSPRELEALRHLNTDLKFLKNRTNKKTYF